LLKKNVPRKREDWRRKTGYSGEIFGLRGDYIGAKRKEGRSLTGNENMIVICEISSIKKDPRPRGEAHREDFCHPCSIDSPARKNPLPIRAESDS